MPELILKIPVSDEAYNNLLANLQNQVTVDNLDGGNGVAVQETPAEGPPAPAASAPVELDAAGVPWNADYHAKTKTKTAKGEWKIKKGCDKDALAAWKVSLSQTPEPEITTNPEDRQEPTPAFGTQPPPGALQMPDIPAALNRLPVSETTAPETLPNPLQQPAALPGLPGVVPVPTAPVSMDDVMTSFQEFSNLVGADAAATHMPGVYQMAGVTDPNELQNNETLRAKVKDTIDTVIAQSRAAS